MEIYSPRRNLFSDIQRILFIPSHYQSGPDLEFGQLPSKTKTLRTQVVNQPVQKTELCGESMLLKLIIVICSAGLLYILIHVTH